MTRRLASVAAVLAAVGCGPDESPTEDLTILYDETIGHVVVQLGTALPDASEVFTDVRRGRFGQLDCERLLADASPASETQGLRVVGTAVAPELLEPFYGPAWESEPTPEMIAQAEVGTDSIIDLCITDGEQVVRSLEYDLFRAWDNARARGVGGKADGPEGEQMIHSVQEYGERCVAELGEIPFFEKTGEGTYTTYSCLDAVQIPMTVTEGGQVTHPEQTVTACDKPQYIYSLCEPGPRVASRVNDEGTRWVLLCRKSIGGLSSDQYNDIAMIGHNPYTGKTCFIQNALYQKKDGGHVPHPADVEKSENLWSGVHGGLGSGIQCAKCHDADPFVHSPWIDGAKDPQGRPVVPKMGYDEDFEPGYNDAPYSIVNRAGQGWTMPKQIVSEEGNACLSCHRIGNREWMQNYLRRLDGEDSAFFNITTAEYRKFHNLYWMPPELDGLNELNWAESNMGQALNFLQSCGTNPSLCATADIPDGHDAGGGGGPVNLPDNELALAALQLLGAEVEGATSRCNQCHGLTRGQLRDWEDLTDNARNTCLSPTGGGGQTHHEESGTVQHNDFVTFGPFEVPEGGTINVEMTGTGDADVYVKRNQPASMTAYDCRPYTSGSDETCGASSPGFDANGPASYHVGVHGWASQASSYELSITITGTSGEASPLEKVNCLRLTPSDPLSPFDPHKLGIYTASAHLKEFKDLFQAAYPTDAPGNDSYTWLREYSRFKRRVGMPKGNSPRLSQSEFDIIAEWFKRGLPKLEETLPEEPLPSDCTPYQSAALIAHVDAMKTQGWSAVNQDNGMLMFGCSSSDPLGCLASFPRANSQSFGQGWEHASGAKLRILRQLNFTTSYWTRSSADGRFVANGGGPSGATISDLLQNVDIGAQASFDPGFFPDNSGFVFNGNKFCNQSLLLTSPSVITFNEPGCSYASGIGLYEHLGRGLDGGDYFVINSLWAGDNGGHGVTLSDPATHFTEGATITLTPMIHNGTIFETAGVVSHPTPFEGDSVLSPSTKLIAARLAGADSKQRAYVIRKLNATKTESGYVVNAPEVGRFCVKGTKTAFSYDERFLATHHYVAEEDWAELGFSSPSDAGFVEYRTKGASNIFVMDMTTGESHRVTHMQPGQYALYAHFRSDGWMYLLVRDSNSGTEYVVASDIAVVLADGGGGGGGIPSSWTCEDSWYTDSYCDCGCGAVDPTCSNPNAPLWQTCPQGQTCAAGEATCH